mmetsp:Transcript_15073/g.37662  ORF Transcript_15073/g.37662 Transcript_15073/m.37662 type:complete len:261 (-) Transcript_15073:3-785(-)
MRTSCHSKMRLSIVSWTMRRITFAAVFCPMREIRPAACFSMPGCSAGSSRTAVLACVRVSPAAPPPPAPLAPPKRGTSSTVASVAKCSRALLFASGEPTSEATTISCVERASFASDRSRVHAEKMTHFSPLRCSSPTSSSRAHSLLPYSLCGSALPVEAMGTSGASSSYSRCSCKGRLQQGQLPVHCTACSMQSAQPSCPQIVMDHGTLGARTSRQIGHVCATTAPSSASSISTTSSAAATGGCAPSSPSAPILSFIPSK